MAAAFVEALSASGLHVEPADLPAWRGASKRAVCDALVAAQRPKLTSAARAELAAMAYARFSAGFETRLRGSADLAIPGVRESIERLKAVGVRVAPRSPAKPGSYHVPPRAGARRWRNTT